MNEFNTEKTRLIIAYTKHHLTWQELSEAIACLELDAFQSLQNIEAA